MQERRPTMTTILHEFANIYLNKKRDQKQIIRTDIFAAWRTNKENQNIRNQERKEENLLRRKKGKGKDTLMGFSFPSLNIHSFIYCRQCSDNNNSSSSMS